MVKLIGIPVIIFLIAFVHNSDYEEQVSKSKPANPKYSNHGLVLKACIKTNTQCPMMATRY